MCNVVSSARGGLASSRYCHGLVKLMLVRPIAGPLSATPSLTCFAGPNKYPHHVASPAAEPDGAAIVSGSCAGAGVASISTSVGHSGRRSAGMTSSGLGPPLPSSSSSSKDPDTALWPPERWISHVAVPMLAQAIRPGSGTTEKLMPLWERQARRGVPGQPAKASVPMTTGPGGSAISLRDVHLRKAHSPISVRLGGSVISLKDVHLLKAHSPILVRVGGSVISVKDVHM